MKQFTPDLLIEAYAEGVFPMAESRTSQEINWIDPDMRGIIIPSEFRTPRSLKKFIRKSNYTLTIDKDFKSVIENCANSREDSWINREIKDIYIELFERGFAHSIECWDGNKLIGGLYGVAFWRAFFGESMFSLKTNASKVALCYLVETMKENNFILLDVQFLTDHLKQFGAKAITREQYHLLLAEALNGSKAGFTFVSEEDYTSYQTIME